VLRAGERLAPSGGDRQPDHLDRSLGGADPHGLREALYARVTPSFQPSPVAAQYVGMTIPDLARECLRRNAISLQGVHGPALIDRALQSTSDFPLILGDTVGRTLRDAHAAAPVSIKRICRQTTVPDFRKKSILQLDSSGVMLEKVGEHGEFKSSSFEESGESYRAETFGRIIGFTRQALINDDLSAFTDVTRRLGLVAAEFEAQQLVNLLTAQGGTGPDMADDTPLFDADHHNLAGSGAAPSETTLNAACHAMRRQTSFAGALISVVPAFILAPPELETATEKLLTQFKRPKPAT
jgi:hypothetical protein